MAYLATIGLLGIFLVINILIVRPQWWIGIVVLTVAATVPVQIPMAVPIGGFGVYLSEIALLLAALFVGVKYQANRLSDFCSAAVFAATTVFALYGILSGYPTQQVAGDSRGLFALALALFVAGRVAGTPIAMTALKAVRATLWLSFVFISLAALDVVQIAGRTSDASLDPSSSIEVTRIQSPTTHLAASVVAISIALCVAKPGSFRVVLPYLIPALGITFFAYSRNALVLVAITAVLTPLLERRFRAWVRMMVVAGCLWVVFVATGWTLSQLADLPGFGYLHRMYVAYSDRVIGGLSAEAQLTDSSILYRQLEVRNMKTAITDYEVVGHGLGYAYQPQRDRNTPTSSFYGHHFYIWAIVKTGFLGLLIYLVALIAPLVRATKWSGNPFRSACASAAVAVLYVSTVAPMPMSTNGGPLLGALLGVAAGLWPSAGGQGKTVTTSRGMGDRKSKPQSPTLSTLPS
ncbi:O-antigen ligase family protein [Rhodococcus sp. USK13]|uniref:O-antigen ligase family protein n=1 Tax=Rhodococcus sp. USK13 TaxID=2806442 RepID=UPI001BCE0778|nr:O-antigen ligase family protein [Rhodococcus sp. USK13]